MATGPGSMKSHRRFATYGKSPHRPGFDFDVPASPDQSEDELQSAPTLLHRHIQIPTASRDAQSSQGSKNPPAVKKGVAAEGDLGQPLSIQSKESQRIESVESETDPFDVPSSGDDSAQIASPLKPAAKRRRIPGNERNGTLTPSSSKGGDQTSKKEAWLGRRDKVDEDSPNQPKSISTTSKEQVSQPTSNKLKAAVDTPRNRITHSPRQEGMKRKALEETATPRKHLPVAIDHVVAGRRSVTVSAKSSTQELRGMPRNGSAGSPFHEPGVSHSEPQTPPSERRRRDTLSPDIGKEGSLGSAFAFMSPSGLDFLGLDISESPGNLQPQKESRTFEPRPASALKAKLKDRLAKRDGASYSDSDGDRFMNFDSESASTQFESSLPSRYHGHLPIRDEQSEDPGASSSQLDSDSTPRISLGTGPRHTYAARNRTLRKDENATEDEIFASLAEVNESASTGTRRIRTDIQPRNTQESAKDSMDYDESDDGQVAALRNIHELRESGANARLRGETEAILDEIESENTSTRRNGLLDLLQKLQSKAFSDMFGATGLDIRLLGRTHIETDMVSKVLLSMALLQILVGQASLQTLAQYKDRKVLLFLETLLGETESLKAIVRNRKSNATKALQQGIEQMCQSYLQLMVWKFGAPAKITPRVISLHLLEHLARYIHNGDTTEESLPLNVLELLTEILASSSTLSVSAECDVDFLATLSILETSTLGHDGFNHESREHWRELTLESLTELLTSARDWDFKEQSQTLSLLLRLGINLTNNDMAASAVFARSQVINAVTRLVELHFGSASNDTESHMHIPLLDNLILSLGFLINLAENSRSARELFAQSSDGTSSPLDVLLRIFTSKLVKAFEVTSEEESRESVPLGYLAVLLAFISTENEIRVYVASRLDGGTLRHLLIAVDAFLSYHRRVAEDFHGSDESSEFKVHFVGRVQSVLDQLKNAEL